MKPLLVVVAVAAAVVAVAVLVAHLLDADPEGPRDAESLAVWVPVEGQGDRARPTAPRETPATVAPRDDPSTAAPVVLAAPTPGSPFEHELIEAPSPRFGAHAWTTSDSRYAADIEGLDSVEYDPALGRAARELAVFYSLHGAPAPTEVLQFILNSAGAAEWGVLQSYLWTTDIREDAVRRRVEQLAEELAFQAPGTRTGPLEEVRVGVGEAFTVGPRPERVVAVITSRGGLFLDPLPRRVDPGGSVIVSGSLPRGAREPRLVALFPDGQWVETSARYVGDRFSARLDPPRGRDGRFAAGPLLVELLASLAHGPTPLAQLELMVGAPLPERFAGRWPSDESAIGDEVAAERRAFELLARDRARHGLAPLEADPALVAIARAHGRDMRAAGYFGHNSPTTGTLGDRLERAGYRASTFAENIAANASLHDAQAGLYYSLGHRKNILGAEFSHVGVGVVAREGHGRRQWLVTQVFARPVERVDVHAATEELYRRVAETHGRLARDSHLEQAARAALTAPGPSPRGVLDRAKAAGLTGRGAWASVAQLAELGSFEVPSELADPAYRRVGVVVSQDPDAPPPNVVVIVLVTGG